MAPLKIGIVGAAGETGKSIVNGLLQASDVHLIALVRPSSMDKPANKTLEARGVELRSLDLEGEQSSIVASLKGIEILISAVGPFDQLAQIPLATAAKAAGVRRFFPCAAVSIIPAGGIHFLRDEKEKVYNHVKKIGLSYTVVDVGWWYQISWPGVPSGKLDEYGLNSNLKIAGVGNVPSALTDLRDIGRYFAKLIRDERTFNKYVLVYNELWTQIQIWDAVSRIAGEDVPKVYNSSSQLEATISEAQTALEASPKDIGTMLKLISAQYAYSWGVRGDNTPEYAKYLGYVTSKDLYPEMEYTGLEAYLEELVAGRVNSPYEERKGEFKEMLKNAGMG